MLDDYKENKFYDYAINLKKYYHAYLFEVDDILKMFPMIIAFAKMIICKNHYTNNNECNNCNICHLIDKNYYQDLLIIEPDGISIKKEQIQIIQRQFSLKSTNNTNQIYIIKQADKMNLSAANSLLKFLEEPVEGIYAILITENRKQMLPTILSRVNLITLKTNNKLEYNLEDISKLSKFLRVIHLKKQASLPYIKTKFLNFYQTREEIIKAFNTLEIILDELIKKNYQINSFDKSFYDILEKDLKDLSYNDILFYLEIIVNYKNKLLNNLNLNINLFMDRFVIEISGGV